MISTFKRKSLALIKNGEGSIDHMYLDTAGNVTIGVGNLLASGLLAAKHPFVYRHGGRKASKVAIEAEFKKISRLKKGKRAGNYKRFTELKIKQDSINLLLGHRIKGFLRRLKLDFPSFQIYPEPARLGLLDMAYNLGNKGLIRKFPKFTKAARKMDWKTCAKECHRRGIQESRNKEARKLFLLASRL